MKPTLAFGAIAFWTAASTLAAAGAAPDLPKAAQKLAAASIVTLYDGAKATFDNFTMDKPLTGETFYNFKKKRMWGFYNTGNTHGVFKGTIRMKKDTFCYAPSGGKETCIAVYRDGDAIYEVTRDGKVSSRNKVSPAAAPAVPAFAAFVSGKTVDVTVYDQKAPIIARLTWDWTKKTVTGRYVYDGADEGKVSRTISFDGDKACSIGKGENKPTCYAVSLSGPSFFEVNENGSVHAVSMVE